MHSATTSMVVAIEEDDFAEDGDEPAKRKTISSSDPPGIDALNALELDSLVEWHEVASEVYQMLQHRHRDFELAEVLRREKLLEAFTTSPKWLLSRD